MKNVILFIVLAILTSVAFGGSPIIFKGKVGYMLASDGIQYNNDVKILSGSLDPSLVAVDAPLGSTYISTSTGGLYQKADAGSSTNWFPLLIGSAGTGTDNCVARWDGTGTTSIQDALLCVDDLGVATGLTQLLIDNLDLNGNTISSTDVNGAINLAPNGTGVVNISGPAASRPMKLDASNNVTSGLIDLADSTNDVVGVLPILNGGTGSSTQNFVDLSTAQTVAGDKDLTGRFTVTSVIDSSVPAPVMTTIQRDGIAAPSEGDQVYNSDTNQINTHNGTSWDSVSDTAMARLSGSTYSTIQDMQNLFHSAGITSGNGISDGGAGTVDVGAGTGFIRATASGEATLYYVDWSATVGLVLTDNALNFVYLEYNAGTPQIVATVTERTDFHTNILMGTVTRIGTTVHLSDSRETRVADHASYMIQRLIDTMPFQPSVGNAPSIGEVGTRNLSIGTGAFWDGLTDFSTAAVDTSATGTFDYYYSDGVGGFTAVTAQTQISNTQYDDGTGTLATISNNKYGTNWVYIQQDGKIVVQYGEGDYSLAEAQDAAPPSSVPLRISGHGRLLGKVIIKKSDTVFTSLESAFDSTFNPSAASEHNTLVGLQGGAASEYYHFDATEFGFLDGQDQALKTTDSPTFAAATLSGMTAKSVLFAGTGGLLSEDNANFTWDDTANRLGLGTSTPSRLLDVNGSSIFAGLATFQGEIGGQYQYMNSTTVFSIPYPRMTTGQVALASNLQGAGAYDTTTDRLSLNDGTYDRPVAFVHDSSSKMNLIDDHSFEMGVTEGTCTTCTASSETTNVELTTLNTKSLKMAFSASVGDYTDTTTTNSQYTGVTGLVSARIKTDQEDVWLCSIVDSAESHCVEVNSDGVWDVYKINSTMSSTNFGIKIKASTAITGSVYVDEVFAGSKELEVVATQGKTQTISHDAAHSTLLSLTTDIRFAIGNISSDIEGCLDVVDDAGNTQTKFVANESCNVNVFASMASDLINERIFIKLNGTTTIGSSSEAQRNNGFVTFGGIPLHLNSGDYFTIYANGTIDNGASIADFKISATPQQNKAVTVSVDDDSMTDWVDFTPTGTWATNTTYTGQWRKVGEEMEVRAQIDLTGAPNAAQMTINIPNSKIIDTTKLSSDTSNFTLGKASLKDGGNVYHAVQATYNSTTSVTFIRAFVNGTNIINSAVSETSPFTWGTGDSAFIQFTVPIVGWSSRPTALATVKVTDNAPEEVEGKGNGGTVLTADVTDIDFTETVDNYGRWNGTQYTASEAGWYSATGGIALTATSTLILNAYVDGVKEKMIGRSNAASALAIFSGQIYLEVGEALSFRINDNKTLSNHATRHTIVIRKTSGELGAFIGNVDLKEYVSTPSASKPVIFSALVTPTNGSTCTISNQIGDIMTSATAIATGECTVNFTGLVGVPNCQLTPSNYGGAVTEGFYTRVNTLSSSALKFMIGYGSSGAAAIVGTGVGVRMNCHGVQ